MDSDGAPDMDAEPEPATVDGEMSYNLQAPAEHTGVMVAFFVPPTEAEKLALQRTGALPPDELHLTLAFLGDTTQQTATKVSLIQALSTFAKTMPPIAGVIGGAGMFNNDEGGGARAMYASFDAANLPGFRYELVRALKRAGFAPSRLHGFTPHITLAYVNTYSGVDPSVPELKKTPLTFDKIWLAWGGERISFDLAGDPNMELGQSKPVTPQEARAALSEFSEWAKVNKPGVYQALHRKAAK